MSAFDRGYAAYNSGGRMDENPYNSETSPFKWLDWREGWRLARREEMERADAPIDWEID